MKRSIIAIAVLFPTLAWGAPTPTATPTPVFDLAVIFGSPVPTPQATATPIACNFTITHNPILSDGSDSVEVRLVDSNGNTISTPQTIQITLATGMRNFSNVVYPASIKASAPGQWITNVITPGEFCTGLTIVACPNIVNGVCQ